MALKSPHILVIEVLPASVDLVLQREVKCHVLYALPWEHFGPCCIVHSLEMADHVREPDSQTVVAGESKAWSQMGQRRHQNPIRGLGEQSTRVGACSPLPHLTKPLLCSGDFTVFYAVHHTLLPRHLLFLPSVLFPFSLRI